MSKTLRRILSGLAALLIAIACFALGARSQFARNEQIKVELASIQAMLSFNHLLRYRELEDYLSRGCPEEALEKVRVSIDQEMSLLASFSKEYEDAELDKYISMRDPTLLKQLEDYKSKYDASWTEPRCPKPAL